MRSPGLCWISASDPPEAFPDIDLALREPDGLLAVGGDLSEERLLYAYRNGIFPWYDQGQPILWWSPDPRCVLLPAEFHLSGRNRRALRNSGFAVTFNTCFADVVSACAAPRPGQEGTWITPALSAAYATLHAHGWAHAVEVRHDGQLVGGLYGIAIGRVFFAESMFSRAANASKLAMHVLCELLYENDCPLIDCQVESRHLMSLGAALMQRSEFRDVLRRACCPAQPLTIWPSETIDSAACFGA